MDYCVLIETNQLFFPGKVPLEVQKLFVENKDGSYTHQESKREELESYAETYRKLGQKPIKPFELKTFLKVGEILDTSYVDLDRPR